MKSAYHIIHVLYVCTVQYTVNCTVKKWPGATYEEAVISLEGSSILFSERDKSPIQGRVSKIPPKSTLGKLNVGTASTVR